MTKVLLHSKATSCTSENHTLHWELLAVVTMYVG